MLKDLREKPELTQFTLENNKIVDVDGMCQVFAHLKTYDKLEGINFRQNNFDDRLIEALADGIRMKKELRVRCNCLLDCDRRWTWGRTG